MKILHISDLHIGSSLTTHLEPTKVTQRRREIVETFRRAVELAKEEGVGAILIAGDLFDTEHVGPRMLTQVRDIIRTHKEIPFFYVAGNHEGDAFSETGATLSNFHTFGDRFSYYDLEDVRIHGANQTAANMFDTLEVDREKKNIVMLHGEWDDHSKEGGFIGIDELSGSGVGYLALGHYHSYMTREIYLGGIAVYSGTPEGRGYDEDGEKGVVLFDTDDFVPHFCPIAKRTIHIVKVDVTGKRSLDEITADADVALASIPSSDLVELVFIGACDPTVSLDESLFTFRFASCFYHFRLKNKTHIDTSAESLRFDNSIMGEFIRQVYADTSLSEDEKRDIVECGLLAIRKEDWGK